MAGCLTCEHGHPYAFEANPVYMRKIACLIIPLLLSVLAGCRSERVAYNCLSAAPTWLAAPRLPPGSPSTGPLASPAPTAPAAARGGRTARPRRRRLFTAAAEVPPLPPAADPAATPRQQQRQRLGRAAPQRSGPQRRLPPLARGLLVLAGILLGLGLLIKLIFGTSFLVAFGIVAGLVVVGLAVLVLVLKNSKGFGWH